MSKKPIKRSKKTKDSLTLIEKQLENFFSKLNDVYDVADQLAAKLNDAHEAADQLADVVNVMRDQPEPGLTRNW